MAMIVRCSSIIPITNSGVLVRRNSQSDLFSRDTNVSGKLTYIPFKLQKFISTLREACSRPFDLCRAFVDSQSVYMEMDDIKASILDQSWDLGQIPPDCIATSGNFALHQERVLTRSTLVTVLVMNALMLAAPLEALAETCEADKSFSMPLLLFVALIGATVGGLLARQRRGELERLNEQLRQINAALRRQAKTESYAHNLSYAPVGSRILENEVIVDSRKQDLTSRLKNGKNYLRNRNPEKAFSEFRSALELAQNIKDPIEEKKAARGLGASLQRQGKYREAITYHSMVLAISEREREDSGNTEAYGAIADCYTELGDLERAAKYYDQYIARLQSD